MPGLFRLLPALDQKALDIREVQRAATWTRALGTGHAGVPMLRSEISREKIRVYFQPRKEKPSEAKRESQNEKARPDPSGKGGEKVGGTDTREEHGVTAQGREGSLARTPIEAPAQTLLHFSCSLPTFLNALASSSRGQQARQDAPAGRRRRGGAVGCGF